MAEYALSPTYPLMCWIYRQIKRKEGVISGRISETPRMSLCPAGQVRQEVAQGSGGQVRQEVAQASVVGAASDVAGHTGQVRQEVAQGMEVRSVRRLRRLLW